ncbi:MAG: MBL fold metallo-hydrolase, partial [Nitrosopumilus sp.]
MKLIIFALIPLILSIGLAPVIPFSNASESAQICIGKVWIENSKGKIACVTPTTAEKLVERGWGTLLIIDEDISDEKSIIPVVSGGTLPITSTPILGTSEKEFSKNYIPGTEELDEDEIRLTFLGTGMPFPTRNQAAAGILMEFGNGEILMFDVGSGTVANFNSLKIPPADLTKFFITHLHTDHQGDFDMFWAQGMPFGRILPMQVWGPNGDGHALGVEAFVDGIITANYWDLKSRTGTVPTSGTEIITHEFDWTKTQIVYEENDITVTSFPAVHAMAGAVSYRIDWNDISIVYSGDTKINNFMVEQAQGVDVLIHETFLPAEIFSEKTGMALEAAKTATNEFHTPAKAAGVIFELTQPKMGVM